MYQDENTMIVDWLTMLQSTPCTPPVRTKGFEIDGPGDPKRVLKGFTPAPAMRHRQGFTGATVEDMPRN